MNIPTIRNYGQYSSDNYGVNSLAVSFPNGPTLYYSYNTIVAFTEPNEDVVIRRNEWGPTTGKHLNWIDDNKEKRISREEFESRLNVVLKKYTLS